MSPTIITQNMVTKDEVNLNLDMNTDAFWTYLKQRFNENFANLVCYELHFFVPMAFMSVENLDSLKKYIDRRIQKLNENSIKIYFEYQGDLESKIIMNESYLMVIDNFREEVIQLIKKKKRSFGSVMMSDSTDTSTDNDKCKSKKRKGDSNSDTKELSVQRRKRQIRASKHNRNEWSFSSDEYVLPTSAELGSPCKSSAQYDYDLYTIGRLDQFCYKHLMLKNATEVRTFQHQAQCELQMHQEHLYEYFRFIRNNDHVMAILKNHVKDNITNCNDNNIITKIHLMIDKLVEIKQHFGFTSFGYKTNDK